MRADGTAPFRWHSNSMPRERGSILAEGRNCWRIAGARRAAFLVDGERCFAAMASAFERAERSILIASWDIHSRLRLRPGGPDRTPELRDFLVALLERRPALEVRILTWDFAMI